MSFKIYIDQFPNYDNNPDQGKRKHDDSKIIELEFTIKFQRKPTHFSRWMNLVNFKINIFGSLKNKLYICKLCVR